MYKLVISDDEGKATVVPFIRDEITIGRREGNTIRLTERNVSRSHARVVRIGEDLFRIEDLGSRCGTKVGGVPIEAGGKEIGPGEQIAIGDYNLSIRTDVDEAVPLGRQMDPGEGAGIGKVTTHARLVQLNGDDAGREVDLTADLYVIGRSEEANCRIEDPSISRAHARIDGDDGKWTISDLDSINGILVNGLKRDDYLLKPGDVIELGVIQLRYVAPGEPYEFRPPDAPPPVAPGNAAGLLQSRSFHLAAGGVILLVLVIVLVVALGGGEGQRENQAGTDGSEDVPFAELIERGKDAMQTEQWAEAARLFALAQIQQPEDALAREMKTTAVSEAEAQKAFNDALVAGENKDWTRAVTLLASIKRSSHYYDLAQLQKMSAKLCEELLVKARFVAQTGDREAAQKVLGAIADIPEASEDCLAKRDELESSLQRPAVPRPQDRSQIREKLPDNPYGDQPPRPRPQPPRKPPGGGTVTNPYG